MIKTCIWCAGQGHEIGVSWGYIIIMKCNSCHHEWTIVKDDE